MGKTLTNGHSRGFVDTMAETRVSWPRFKFKLFHPYFIFQPNYLMKVETATANRWRSLLAIDTHSHVSNQTLFGIVIFLRLHICTQVLGLRVKSCQKHNCVCRRKFWCKVCLCLLYRTRQFRFIDFNGISTCLGLLYA